MQKELCTNCYYFRTIKFQHTEIHKCRAFDIRLKTLATECTDYMQKSNQNLSEMEKIAWMITKTKKMGFDGYRIDFIKPKPKEQNS